MHREALKQSATDPISGKIDVNILTTGLSTAARKKKQMVIDGLRTFFDTKIGQSTHIYRKLFNDLKDQLQVVSNKYVITIQRSIIFSFRNLINYFSMQNF